MTLLGVLYCAERASEGWGQPAREVSTSWIQELIIALLLVLAVIIAGPLLALAMNRRGRRELVKSYYLFRSLIGVDIGFGAIIRLIVIYGIGAAGLAYVKGVDKSHHFHWDLFFSVLILVTVASVISNVVENSNSLPRILGPSRGQVFRDERKAATAGLLKRLNRTLTLAPVPPSEALELIQELLDVIVLHVRDYRGRHDSTRVDVFANLVLEDGDSLVVVARDSMLHSANYERPVPRRYPKSALLCGRAMEARKPLSVGELTTEYPEGPLNKPYRSVLAIPLIWSNDETVVGALSIDSSIPFCFQSFRDGVTENALENSLQPYIQLLMLILERLVSQDPATLLGTLKEAWRDTEG